MSVVAFDGRIVASDTFMGSFHSGQGGKFHKIAFFDRPGKKDSLVGVGITGSAAEFFPCLAWLLGNIKTPCPASDDTSFIVFRPGKNVQMFSDNAGPIYFSPPFAEGSGGNHAEAAMAMGADALNAVTVACQFVNTCQPPIDGFDMEARRWIQQSPDIPTNEGIHELAKRYKWRVL